MPHVLDATALSLATSPVGMCAHLRQENAAAWTDLGGTWSDLNGSVWGVGNPTIHAGVVVQRGVERSLLLSTSAA